MRVRSAKSQTFSTHSLFPAFFLAMIGWGMLHAWGLGVDMGMLSHAFAAMPGLVLSGLVLYRYRQHWPLKAGSLALPHEQDRKPACAYRTVAFCLLLTGIGFGIALIISSGSLSLLILAAAGMMFVPWAQMAVCRDHFLLASALIEAGALAGLVVLDRSLYLLHYPVAAWVLLTLACMAVISAVVIHGKRLDRMPPSGY